jgi:hypothetical protein
MRIARWLVAALALTVMHASTAHAVLITDCCDWSAGWTFSSVDFGSGTASATVEGTGGNPGARLNVTTVTPDLASTAFGTAILNTFTTSAVLAGASFTLTLDVLSGAGGFGEGQAIQLLVEQNGTVYGMPLGITGFPLNTFTTLNFPGTFNAGSFTRLSGAGPSTPAFDGSVVTTFGFAAGNTNSATLTQYYDNFRLSIPSIGGPAAAVPTLSEWSMIGMAALLAGVGVWTLRRRLARGGDRPGLA